MDIQSARRISEQGGMERPRLIVVPSATAIVRQQPSAAVARGTGFNDMSRLFCSRCNVSKALLLWVFFPVKSSAASGKRLRQLLPFRYASWCVEALALHLQLGLLDVRFSCFSIWAANGCAAS